MIPPRLLRYVGPADLMSLAQADGAGASARSIHSPAEFDEWASAQTAEELGEPFTLVIC